VDFCKKVLCPLPYLHYVRRIQENFSWMKFTGELRKAICVKTGEGIMTSWGKEFDGRILGGRGLFGGNSMSVLDTTLYLGVVCPLNIITLKMIETAIRGGVYKGAYLLAEESINNIEIALAVSDVSKFLIKSGLFSDEEIKNIFMRSLGSLDSLYEGKTRKFEKNAVTNNPEPTINHSLYVAHNAINVLDKIQKKCEEDVVFADKYSEISKELLDNKNVILATALYHDFFEDSIDYKLKEIKQSLEFENFDEKIIEQKSQEIFYKDYFQDLWKECFDKLMFNLQPIMSVDEIVSVIEELHNLTRYLGESIDQYLAKISSSSISNFVKFSDVLHNSFSSHTEKQENKYKNHYVLHVLRELPFLKDLDLSDMLDKIPEQNFYIFELPQVRALIAKAYNKNGNCPLYNKISMPA